MSQQLNSTEVERLLLEHGFACILRTPRHRKFSNEDGRIVIVPVSSTTLPRVALQPIIKQSGLDPAIFK